MWTPPYGSTMCFLHASTLDTSQLLQLRRGPLNLRTFECMIWNGVLDPTVLSFSGSNGCPRSSWFHNFTTWSTQLLGSHPVNLWVHEAGTQTSSALDPLLSTTYPPQMDGFDLLVTSPLAKSKEFPLWPPMFESLIWWSRDTCPLSNRRFRSNSPFRDFWCQGPRLSSSGLPNSRTLNSRYDTPLGLSLCCSMREDLNLMQLSIDPMVVVFFAQDLMAQTLSSPVPFLFYLDTNPVSRSSWLIRQQMLLLLRFGAFLSDLEEFSIIKGFDLCLLSSANSIKLSLTCAYKNAIPPDLCSEILEGFWFLLNCRVFTHKRCYPFWAFPVNQSLKELNPFPFLL